jgi:hypothetical protein
VYDTKVETEKGINPSWFGVDGVSMSMPMSRLVKEKERERKEGREEGMWKNLR